MKKFFLMLAVALPMLFAMTACGDDDDNPFVSKPAFKMPLLTKNSAGVLQITNNTINLQWGDTQADVKAAMNPFTYVLQESTSTSLAYSYDADYGMPFYTYAFSYDRLASSAITITAEQDSEIDVIKYLEDNNYKDVSTDDDEDAFVYRSKDKETIVYYGFDGNITIMWTPNDGTRANNWRADLNQHLEMVKSIRNK